MGRRRVGGCDRRQGALWGHCLGSSVGLLGEGFLDFIPRNFMVHMAPHELPPKQAVLQAIGNRAKASGSHRKAKKTKRVPGSTRDCQGGFLKLAVSPCKFKIQVSFVKFLFFGASRSLKASFKFRGMKSRPAVQRNFSREGPERPLPRSSL